MTKTILITGASSGIGAGMAREFAQMGYNLAICARRLERLETLKQELESQFGIRVIAKKDQAFFHTGVRFSRKALTPSRWSSLS